MKSFMASPATIERKWYVVDATGSPSFPIPAFQYLMDGFNIRLFLCVQWAARLSQ